MSNSVIILNTVGGISGSLTQLVDGTSYLVAGANVTIASQSNGSVLISATTGSGGTIPSGIYGDGSDGTTIISGDTTLTRDMYYTSLNVNSGKSLFTNGFRIFANVSVIVTGTIDNSGANASFGNSTGAAGGVVGSLKGGGHGGNAPSGAGVSIFGIQGVNAHGGGGFNAGEGGLYTVVDATYGSMRSIPNCISCVCHDPSSKDTIGIGGGGGGGASSNSTGGGGGAGVIVIVSPKIIVCATGSISANGGNGDGDTSGGSGGGGGGLIVLVSQTAVQNNGTISVANGSGGTGHGGNPGSNGASGVIIQLLSP